MRLKTIKNIICNFKNPKFISHGKVYFEKIFKISMQRVKKLLTMLIFNMQSVKI